MFGDLVSVFHVIKATLQIYLVQGIMRLLFAIALFVYFPFCQGQSIIDSIINTTWVDDLNWKLEFDDNDTLLISGYRNSKAEYYINDTLIAYRYVSNTDWFQLRFEYYKDSLVLHSKDLNFPWSVDCYLGKGVKKNSDDSRWVYYNESYLKSKPLGFEKIQIGWRSVLEVDSAGNIFYNIKGRDDLYGHYRGNLSEEQLQKLLKLVDREQLRIKQLSCTNGSLISRSHSRPPTIMYRSDSKSYVTNQYLDYLREEGFETFDFIFSCIDLKKLNFQYYADGDSVPGVVVMSLRHRESHVYQVSPVYLGQYEDEEEKYYLYKCYVDSVCFPHDSFTLSNYADKLIYFYSDTLLNTHGRSLIETEEVGYNWFRRGRAFKKPEGMVYRKLISYKEFPEDYKLVIRGGYGDRMREFSIANGEREHELFPNPFPLPYRTRFGLPYPFLRPDFQVAFEEYVLPDWEEYLKNQKAKNQK